MSDLSEIEQFRQLPIEERQKRLDRLTDEEIVALKYDWNFHSRPVQRTPQRVPPWVYWLILAGRGWGKTRVGAEWVREQTKTNELVNLIGATVTDARDIMIEGEALALDTPIPTPSGWRCLGEIQIGDQVFTEQGEVTSVTWVSAIAEGRPCYAVTFSDEETIIADADHKWLVYSFSERQYNKAPSIRTTEALTHRTRIYNQRNYTIKRPGPLAYPEKELPIDPYVFGCWLGDGTSAGGGYTTNDQEIIDEIRSAGYTVSKWNQEFQYNILGLCAPLRALGVLNNKHIPRIYLEGSIEQRQALLQGLMDTDGYIDDTGHCEFDQNKEAFIIQMWELIRGLGMTCRKSLSKTYSKDFPGASPMLRVQFSPNFPCFRLPKKLSRIRPLSKKSSWVSVTSVEPVESVPVKCIAVAADSHLYLAGKGCTPTHNSGVLAVCAKRERPVFVASKRQLQWPNGAKSLIFTADEPERLRGKQHMKFWADELAAWRYPDAWDQAMLGLRLGKHPQACITTTPRPIQTLRDLIKDDATIVTKGTTYDNRSNLAEAFFNKIIKKYEGSRLGRQELNAELLDDNPGALWHLKDIDRLRVKESTMLARVVVGIDPSVKEDGSGDECGIVVAGLGYDGEFYVLDDISLAASPNGWAKEAIDNGYKRHCADRVVAEINNGGALVESVLRTVDPNVSYEGVHASRGKKTRAEPISALYEQGRVHHVGTFAKLEDEMCQWDPELSPESPNRVDALVWAITMLAGGSKNFVFGSR